MECRQYRIFNEYGQSLVVNYTDCDTGFSQNVSINPGQSATVCAQKDSVQYVEGTTIVDLNSCGTPPAECGTYNINWIVLKTDISVFGATNGSATVNVFPQTTSPNVGTFSIVWSHGPTSFTVNNLSAGTYFFTVYETCENGNSRNFSGSVTINQPSQLIATATKTNVTVNGGSDGTITLSVSGGSGSYTYLWNDSATSQNRTGLAAGTYSVTVTDPVSVQSVNIVQIVITEPEAEPEPLPQFGSVFEVPFLNTLQFVVQGNNNALDNTLFAGQEFIGHTDPCYFQKVEKNDNVILQFNSDYKNHSIELLKLEDDSNAKNFAATLKEQNLGNTDDYSISIRSHGTFGKSRVYFNVGDFPIPLQVDNTFTISNNNDGFNGSYAITDIILDALLGYRYIVINKDYNIAATSSLATGTFQNNIADFNVYEANINLSDVADGLYYLRIRAFSSNEIFAFSEPIDLKQNHPGTSLVTYRNTDNAFDLTWSTGYEANLRVESLFGHKRFPGGEDVTTRNSDYSLVKVSGKSTRVLLFETFMLPPWLHEKLSVAFRCDFVKINSVSVAALEGYAEPSYLDRLLLSNSSIRVEQVGWFDRYNSNDIGSVNETGSIIGNGGFIKR